MTERSATGSEREVVCPFVAFDEDRDFRSSVPDHRHRCFAENPAAARALAHQAAYCLSTAFSGCPTFIDWARREAAPPKDEPIRTLRAAPTAPRKADRPAEPASRPAAPAPAPPSTGRQRRAEWTAPPPWAPDAGSVARPGDAAWQRDEAARQASDTARQGDGAARLGDDAPAHGRDVARLEAPAASDEAPDDEVAASRPGAWSGSALGALAASGSRSTVEPAETAEPAEAVGPAGPAAPAFLAGRAGRPGDGSREAVSGRSRDRDRTPEHGTHRAVDRGPERVMADPAAPAWERPRRFEAYPSLKSSGGGLAALPRPVLYGLIVLAVGLALFATPFVLRGLTGGGNGAPASPTPAGSASPGATVAPSITPVPSPSPTIYTVKAGDVLSRIAVKFGVTVDEIVKANPQIKNPDRLNLGDQLVIPPAVAPAITDGAITPAP